MGKGAWGWAFFSLHKKWALSVFAINVIPAIQTNQFALLIKDELPVAFCSWASLDLECEGKYLNVVHSFYPKRGFFFYNQSTPPPNPEGW
ncbi:toxin-activating lysine-acyltransferase, partial [Escherichia coli]